MNVGLFLTKLLEIDPPGATHRPGKTIVNNKKDHKFNKIKEYKDIQEEKNMPVTRISRKCEGDSPQMVNHKQVDQWHGRLPTGITDPKLVIPPIFKNHF